ncbi:hypothetical protein L4X63_21945 [Geomonas sp. Red32]|uniref:hypothetical protein n=1 Tax=Geomonas sp. Red32 TaxID=2912856 RepID=UPI00202CF059|nr:hypothetical protein [Geomonas sp. Red32]MCM0084250.1 hypothetical protein [Geomonas sp. Red32]
MTKELETKSTGRMTNWLIAGLMVAGALLFWRISDLPPRMSIMSKLFISFLGAVIVVQIIPAILLFGAMLKGLFGVILKKTKGPLEEPKK